MNTINKNIEYNGNCAFAVSTGKTDIKGGKYNLEINGRTFHFSNLIAKFLFKILPNRIDKADKYWENK